MNKIYKQLSLANSKLKKVTNIELLYKEKNKTIWYPIVTEKIRSSDLPNIPIEKINNLYPIQFVDGGSLD